MEGTSAGRVPSPTVGTGICRQEAARNQLHAQKMEKQSRILLQHSICTDRPNMTTTITVCRFSPLTVWPTVGQMLFGEWPSVLPTDWMSFLKRKKNCICICIYRIMDVSPRTAKPLESLVKFDCVAFLYVRHWTDTRDQIVPYSEEGHFFSGKGHLFEKMFVLFENCFPSCNRIESIMQLYFDSHCIRLQMVVVWRVEWSQVCVRGVRLKLCSRVFLFGDVGKYS